MSDDELVYEKRQREFMRKASCYGTMVAICLAIWVLGGFGYFWPAWPIVIGGIGVAKRARRLYATPDRVEVEV
jgi:hypothetical protein